MALFSFLSLSSFVESFDLVNCTDDLNKVPVEYRCECARSADADRDGLLSYPTFHYCTMENVQWLSITILVLWLTFLFFIIAGTADDYLVPALTVGVDLFQISPNVAGVTVLAFANGAPDLFTAIAAFSGEGGDEELGWGILLGGPLFITSFTLGTVIVLSHGLETYRRPLLRDLLALAIAISLLFYMYQDGSIHVFEGILSLCIYACYVSIVVVGRYIYQNYIKPRKARENGDAKSAHDEKSLSPSHTLAAQGYEERKTPCNLENQVKTPKITGTVVSTLTRMRPAAASPATKSK